MSTITPLEMEGSRRTGQFSIESNYLQHSHHDSQVPPQLGRRESDETEDTFSTTDGIDVLGKKFKNDNFAEFNTSWTGKLINDRWVKRIIVSLIMLNAFSMGLSTSAWATNNEEVSVVFLKLDLTFQIIFTAELFLKILHYRFGIFFDGWPLFDLVTISLAWLIPSLLLLRTFRLVRTLRLATKLPPLRKLVLALFESSAKIAAILVLMVLLLYIFAVLFTSFFQDLYQDGYTSFDYFSTLQSSMFTLLQVMTFDGWAHLTKEVMVVYPWAWVFFVLFVSVTSFFVLNLIIAVVCEAVFYVQSTESRKGASLSMSESSGSPNSSRGSGSRRRQQNSPLLATQQGMTKDRLDALEQKMEKLALAVEAAVRLHKYGLESSPPASVKNSPYRHVDHHDASSFPFGAATPPRANIRKANSCSVSEVSSTSPSPPRRPLNQQHLSPFSGEFT